MTMSANAKSMGAWFPAAVSARPHVLLPGASRCRSRSGCPGGSRVVGWIAHDNRMRPYQPQRNGADGQEGGLARGHGALHDPVVLPLRPPGRDVLPAHRAAQGLPGAGHHRDHAWRPDQVGRSVRSFDHVRLWGLPRTSVRLVVLPLSSGVVASVRPLRPVALFDTGWGCRCASAPRSSGPGS